MSGRANEGSFGLDTMTRSCLLYTSAKRQRGHERAAVFLPRDAGDTSARPFASVPELVSVGVCLLLSGSDIVLS